jgi:hypothetical protein
VRLTKVAQASVSGHAAVGQTDGWYALQENASDFRLKGVCDHKGSVKLPLTEVDYVREDFILSALISIAINLLSIQILLFFRSISCSKVPSVAQYLIKALSLIDAINVLASTCGLAAINRRLAELQALFSALSQQNIKIKYELSKESDLGMMARGRLQ